MASESRIPRVPIALCCALLGVGCPLPSQPIGGIADTSTTSDGGDEATPTTTVTTADGGASSQTSSPGTGEGETSAATSPTTDATESTGVGADCAPDLPPTTADECSVFAQDCPACYRCTWAKDDDGAASNQVQPVCMLAPEQGRAPGESCTIDEVGNDDCEVGSFCYPPPVGEYMPRCVSFCAGDDEWTCDVPATYCVGSSSAGAFGCLQACDPLLQDCWEDEVCALTYPTGDGYVCYPSDWDVQHADALDECGSTFECFTGLVCVSADRLGPACTGVSCCTPLCDANDPDAGVHCQDVDASFACASGCEIGSPPGYEDVGLCLVDEEIPGLCPPEGADLTYPWCSFSGGDTCGDPGSFGGGDACNDYCHCYLACDDATDCDVPPTGNATPACHEGEVGESSSCVLECDAGQTCPDGMICSDLFSPALCMWPTPTGQPGC